MATAAGPAINHLLPETVRAKLHLRSEEDETILDEDADNNAVFGPPAPTVALNGEDLHAVTESSIHYEQSFRPSNPWQPTVDTLRLNGDTCMPVAAPHRPAPALAAPVLGDDPNATWQAIRGAVYLQLINNPSTSLVK